MGSCLSILTNSLSKHQDPQQHHHHHQQQQQPQQNASPLSYAAAVAGNALHGLANQLEQQGGAHHGTANAWQNQGASQQASRPPGKNVKFTIGNAYVFKMPDGDTFSVDYPDSSTGQTVTSRVRIMGIDCPETAQNFGPEACEIGKDMAFKKTVTLHVHTTDRYGRLVADIVLPNGQDYASEMLRKGAAWHYKAYDKRQELDDIEREAKNAKIGLWQFARPQEPWVYRKKKRERERNH